MTITVRLPDELEAKLREKFGVQKLDPEDVELLTFVQQAITDKLAQEPAVEPPAGKLSAYEAYLAIYKGWSSGETDRAERSEEILRDMFDAKRRSRQ